MDEKEKLLESLSSFDPLVRKESLCRLSSMVKKGIIARTENKYPWINLHIHTFHSFNFMNWSPSRVVFEGWQKGLKYTGTVDFDTLAGLDETLVAGDSLGIAVTGGFESRVLVDDLREKVINSPSEPGIYYLCGKGFRKAPRSGTREGDFFEWLNKIAQDRNRKVIERLNNFLGDVCVDYEKDVLTLTPSGNPTERHIIESYYARSKMLKGGSTAGFWSKALSLPEPVVREKMEGGPAIFMEMLRKFLIKSGGPGYIAPDMENFPRLEDVVEMIEKAGGVPTGTWLDGTSEGEKDPEGFVSFMKGKGIRAIAIIPERNYNFPDPAERREKAEKLDRFMKASIDMDMPVVCGTEMNKQGQPFVDDFTRPEISVYLDYFLRSASVFF